jgi:hypothetical protein
MVTETHDKRGWPEKPDSVHQNVVLDRIDAELRMIAYARHNADPAKSRGEHLVEVARDVLLQCEAWADMPDELIKYDPWHPDPEDVPF